MDRMNCHLQRHIRKHGLEGGILVYDFSDYFNSAPHGPIYRENERRITDGRVRAVGKRPDWRTSGRWASAWAAR